MKNIAIKAAKLAAVSVAVTASLSHAQDANVTLYGLIDANVQRFSASGAASVMRLGSDGLVSSRFGLRGTEKLGGGLSVNFRIEGSFAPDTGASGSTNTNNQSTGSSAAFFGRQTTVGLTGSFGEVRLGREPTPVFSTLFEYGVSNTNSVGNSGALFYPQFSSVTHVRTSNSVNYESPSIAGFFGAAVYALGENSTNSDGRFVGGRLGYRGGPLSVSIASGTTNYVVGNQTQTTAGASYDLKAVKLTALYARNKKGTVDNSAVHVGATIPFGATRLRLGYSDARLKGGDGANQIQIGLIHDMSKRTALYFDAAQIDNKGKGRNYGLSDGFKPVTPGGKSTGFEAGIRHLF